MSKPQLLIIDKEQFGYLTDAYKWCEYLRKDYDITFVTADAHRPKYQLDGIRVVYIPFRGPKILRAIMFLLTAWFYILRAKGQIFVVYFPSCSVLKRLCPWKKMDVDIRTMAVFPDAQARKAYDDRLRSECSHFDSVTAITKGVAGDIGLSGIKILPLGSDVISVAKKNYRNSIRIIYVGTFRNRNLEHTLDGVKLFIANHPEEDLHYDIVGDGWPGQLSQLKAHAEELGISDVVTFHGFKPHAEILPLFDAANIGVCYVPIVSYYQNQPPTKTFEYIRSGIYCVATDTDANRELISDENGVLIGDSPQDFAKGLETYLTSSQRLDEYTIRKSLEGYSWSNIVDSYLRPILSHLQ